MSSSQIVAQKQVVIRSVLMDLERVLGGAGVRPDDSSFETMREATLHMAKYLAVKFDEFRTLEGEGGLTIDGFLHALRQHMPTFDTERKMQRRA